MTPTPIDWLVQQLDNIQYNPLDKGGYDIAKKIIIYQANAMYEERIKDAYGDGLNAHRTDFCNRDEYYQKTYKKQQ